jgi:mRNA-degrading endonuclease toxin of MazEF toxin-antitoxin module
MAQRGEVLAVRRRLGFGSEGKAEHFVVLQSDVILGALETTVVVPLDDAFAFYAGDPLAVAVSPRESGMRKSQVALVAHLQSVALDRFEPSPISRLKPATLRAVEGAARVLLDLP